MCKLPACNLLPTLLGDLLGTTVHLWCLQYENLTNQEAMADQLQGLKRFLNMDQMLPSSELPLTNYKHQRGNDDTVSQR